MKIIRNNILPPKGFAAINLFGILFVRKEAKITGTTLTHESIHTAQMKELLYIGFYLLYVIFWVINLFRYNFKSHKAYRNICFEREAYVFSADSTYLSYRTHFYWTNKIFFEKDD